MVVQKLRLNTLPIVFQGGQYKINSPYNYLVVYLYEGDQNPKVISSTTFQTENYGHDNLSVFSGGKLTLPIYEINESMLLRGEVTLFAMGIFVLSDTQRVCVMEVIEIEE